MRRSFLAWLVLLAPFLVAHAVDASGQPKFLLMWGEPGSGPGQFRSPVGIAVSPKDDVYVTDVHNARVQKFTTDGRFVAAFDLPWDRPDRRMTMAGGIAADATHVYVSLMHQDTVLVYDDSGRLVRQFGHRGAGAGELSMPGGIVLAADGTLYVADQGNNRVQRFTVGGTFLGGWGAYGSAPGEFGGGQPSGSRFGGPHFLARDREGRIWTTEGTLGRVQRFTPEGTPLAAWGDKGDQPGGFGTYPLVRSSGVGPIAVAVDPRGRVVVSSLNKRVQFFTPTGEYVFGLGGADDQSGRFQRPHGLAFDRRGDLYVVDSGRHRIQKFELPDR